MKSITLFFKNMTIGKGLLLSFSPIIILLLNMKTILLALLVIIFLDMITGIRKAHYAEGIKFRPFEKKFWKVISSKELRKTWRKSTEYIVGIMAFSVLDSMVLGTTSIELLGKIYSISELAVTIACLAEVYSIYENMEAVSGNNLFKRIIGLLPERVRAIFQKKD